VTNSPTAIVNHQTANEENRVSPTGRLHRKSAAGRPWMEFNRVTITRSAKVIRFYFSIEKNRHRIPAVDAGQWPAVEVELCAAGMI